MHWFMWWEEQNVILSGIAVVVLWFVSKGILKKGQKGNPSKNTPKVDDNF